MKNTRLVYSTDPKDNVVCAVCKELQAECRCKPEDSVEGAKFTIVFRLEKNGRGGKTVTVLDGFPRNEAYLKELLRETKVDTTDPMSVFSHVFMALPERVDVLPTENYFYFRFYAGGIAWAGSIRLGPTERANGSLEFGFYKDLADWADEMSALHSAVLAGEIGEGLTRLLD